MADMEYEDIRQMLSAAPAHTRQAISRRTFLKAIAMGVGIAALPSWLLEDAQADAAQTTTAKSVAANSASGNVLVVLEMGGGNDGLNTVIPVSNGKYYDLRGGLAISAGKALPIANGIGLHPNLKSMKRRFDAGNVAIVQGVGNGHLNLSHFESMATWMSGWAKDQSLSSGWLGRYMDGIGTRTDLTGVAVGNAIPLHMIGQKTAATCVPKQMSELFGSTASLTSTYQNYMRRLYQDITDMSATSTGFGAMTDSYSSMMHSSMTRSTALSKCYPHTAIVADQLTEDLTVCANLINANIGLKVLGVTLESFDTHGDQLNSQAALLQEIDHGIDAFYAKLTPAMAKKTIFMTFSEFGRRVQPNGTGTDHGTAAPMFIIGQPVKGGIYGAQPSLTNLDQNGNLKPTVDYQSVYATVLDKWFNADSTQLLGKQTQTIPFLV